MAKLYIDGKLVEVPDIEDIALDLDCPCQITIPVLTLTPDLTPEGKHLFGECRTLPTYFCEHCAREALRGVDVSDPSGWRGR